MFIDFETYSEAGLFFEDGRWRKIVPKSAQSSLALVGAWEYSRHPSTEVLLLAYGHTLGDVSVWRAGDPLPMSLLQHIATGGLVHAYNSFFEYSIWTNVITARMGWPSLPLRQVRDTMAKVRAAGLPDSLETAGRVLDVKHQKLSTGGDLIKTFSLPRNPTKRDATRRVPLAADPVAARKFADYCQRDVQAEMEIDGRLPDLSPDELLVWMLDQRINARGVAVDVEGAAACLDVVTAAVGRYTPELIELTGGAVQTASEVADMREWLARRGWRTEDLDEESVTALLGLDLPADVRRVLQIREALAGSSTKKISAMLRTVSSDGRIRGMFQYHGAATGRWTGKGAQPQNLPNSGPSVKHCACGAWYAARMDTCPRCATGGHKAQEWCTEAVDFTLGMLCATDGSDARLDALVLHFGDALHAVSACLRGLFIAAPGHELIGSDYSAIEAVVLAALAGEEWRLDVFRTHGKIYEMSAAKISGVPFEEIIAHHKATGTHHPLRKTVGKVAELASGYQGWWGAWCNFGADKFMSEAEGVEAIKRWRNESPMIVRMWRGLEDCARSAIRYPGTRHQWRSITYEVQDEVLYCTLPSGRRIAYQQPYLQAVEKYGRWTDQVCYMGVDPKTKTKTKQYGPRTTYGGKLTENVVQAAARDVLAYALVRLEDAGYPIVLHVHDEVVAEVPEGFGSIQQFESIMSEATAWSTGWPIRAGGGWRGRRYRK